MPIAGAMLRPSTARSGSKHKRSPSPSPATAPKTKNIGGGAQRRRSPLSDLNSGDTSAARTGCFRFLLSSASGSKSTPRTPVSGPTPRPESRRIRANRLPDQGSRTKTEQWTSREPRSTRQEPNGGQIRRMELMKKQGITRRQQQAEALTPERKADTRATPSSGTTPPIYASISPEVLACGSATPACFAAGHHVVPGVRDRRKCRARGILEIAREVSNEEVDTEPSRMSTLWPSSPSGEAGTCSTKCGNEASNIWMPSPSEESAAGLLDDEIFVPRCSSEGTFWRFSPDCTGLLGSPVLGDLLDFDSPASEISDTTPPSGFLPVQKTPSTGESISPFSLIVKRASHSSRLRSLCDQQGLVSHLHGSAADPTPISGDSWSSNASKCSGFARTSGRPVTMMDPVVECLEMMSLSPRPGDPDYDGNGALPAALPDLSFQFAGDPTPLESIDLSSFKRSPCDTDLRGENKSFWKPVLSDARISWRDGLVSRMFDIGDLDCCELLSEDEDEPVTQGNGDALHDTMFQPTSASCLQEGADQPASCGFGSVEFSFSGGEVTNDSKASTLVPVSVAESMRAEGFELVSSDEDWTLFYKNGLFET